MDTRDSAERGIRKTREDAFHTPTKSQFKETVEMKGVYAPMRARKGSKQTPGMDYGDELEGYYRLGTYPAPNDDSMLANGNVLMEEEDEEEIDRDFEFLSEKLKSVVRFD